jgi:hypothetical protein
MKFKSNDFKIFINTLCYNNVDDYDFLGCKVFFIKDLFGLNVFKSFDKNKMILNS